MKTDIIIGIILTLLNKDCCTAKFLSTKYEVSTKTIYRYISILDSCNVPIYAKKGRNGGIFILNTFHLKKSFFTLQEKMSLIEVCSQINDTDIRNSIQTKLLAIN